MTSATPPAGATGKCKDGIYTMSKTHKPALVHITAASIAGFRDTKSYQRALCCEAQALYRPRAHD